MKKVYVEMEFTVGTLKEIGLGGLKQPWIDAVQNGREYSLTTGAGVGSSLLEASVSEGGRAVYARADMSEFAPEVFDMLTAALAELAASPARPDPGQEAG